VPDLKQRFHDDLVNNDRLCADLKKNLLGILGDLPDGQALCRCDFHAGDVFFDSAKYTVIDLPQVSRGDPAADAACSHVAYSFADRELAEYYLKSAKHESRDIRGLRARQQIMPKAKHNIVGSDDGLCRAIAAFRPHRRGPIRSSGRLPASRKSAQPRPTLPH
jgi:hypothetical protein